MANKLEKLALCIRRAASDAQEWVDPDAAFKHYEVMAREDRLSGDFPYDDQSITGVKEFYAGKDILITGGSGFIGKVLIEKILRSLPEAGKVFLLLRGRKGLSPQQRVQAMLELPLFKLLMTENPEAADRLVAVDGDCSSLGLGLSPTDRQTLINKVSIVFHCAATVRFDLSADHMILVNTRGTREVVSLCKELKKLEAFVHVSTAYCNATKGRTAPIPERILRQDIDWRTVIAAAEKAEQSQESQVLDFIFEKMTTKHQNNYTFTKALAEDIIADEAKDLPAIVVRPTVVIATFEDPFGGWVDNLYGPMSIWDGIGQGVVRTHLGDGELALDYLPVDISAKCLIAAAWHRGIGFRTSSDPADVDVVNNGTADVSKHKCITLHYKKQILYDRGTHKFIFRYPRFHVTKRFWLFWLITVLSHIPMGILADVALKIKGRKPMLLNIYRRLYFAQTKLLHFFSVNPFQIDQQWQYKIQARMTKKEDRDRFDWVTKNYAMAYYHDNIEGIIKYVFKEPAVPKEQSNRQIMLYLDWVQNALLAILGWWILSGIFFR